MAGEIAELFDLSTIETLVKGFIIGLVAAAPTGPSAVLCIERTLDKGRLAGFITAAGIWLSDAIYVLLSILGVSFVMDFVENPKTFLMVKIIGAGLLIWFGIHTMRNNPFRKPSTLPQQKSIPQNRLFYYPLSGFGVAITNPLVIFIYIALFAYLSFPISELKEPLRAMAYLSVLGGDICWWFILTWGISLLRNRISLKSIWVINRILGAILIIAALVLIIYTINNLC